MTFHNDGGQDHVEEVKADPSGHFRTDRALGTGETATIVVHDAWGDEGAEAAHLG